MNLAVALLGGALTCIGMGIGAMLINWRLSRRHKQRGLRPRPLPPPPAKLACFFCDGETYNPDGICGQCRREGRTYAD